MTERLPAHLAILLGEAIVAECAVAFQDRPVLAIQNIPEPAIGVKRGGCRLIERGLRCGEFCEQSVILLPCEHQPVAHGGGVQVRLPLDGSRFP